MMRKKLVYRDGKWIEAYIDCGPGKPYIRGALIGERPGEGRKASKRGSSGRTNMHG